MVKLISDHNNKWLIESKKTLIKEWKIERQDRMEDLRRYISVLMSEEIVNKDKMIDEIENISIQLFRM